ncbi:MAG: hypothetical protein JNL39_04865 [Opitutaceae bacterium]|nr:hypothetical protein [Opitutaceae bacterium]
MKTSFRVSLAGLALAAALPLRAEVSAQAWLETYYLNPQPAELPRAVERLSQSGYLDREGNTAVAIGFIAAVFAAQPDRVETWLTQLRTQPARVQRLLAAAIWQSGHPLGNGLLRSLSTSSPVRAEIEHLATLPPQVLAETTVRSPSSMRLQWGAFLATGHERHIVAILDGFGSNDPQLTSAARLALARHAADHPRVLEICLAQLAHQPDEIRGELRAALAAASAPPRS